MRPPWNFGESRRISLSLDEFLAQQETTGVKFFDGKEPWIEGINKLNWKTFFRVCTEEMDDLSVKATEIVSSIAWRSWKKRSRKSTENPRSPALKPL
jgi:hypothetical protein